MKQTNGKSNKFLKFVSLLLLYLGVFFICLPLFRNMLWVEKTTGLKITEMHQLAAIDQIPFDQIKAPTIPEILRVQDEYSSAGQIYLPAQGIDLPVFSGLSQMELIIGAAAMYPQRDPKRGNMVLVGHHLGYSDVLFGKLLAAKPQEKVYLRYLGEYFAYQIQSVGLVNEKRLEVLAETSEPILTLVTCDRGTTTENRLIVKAVPLKAATQKGIKRHFQQRKQQTIEEQRQIKLRQIWLPIAGLVLLLAGLTYLIIKKV